MEWDPKLMLAVAASVVIGIMILFFVLRPKRGTVELDGSTGGEVVTIFHFSPTFELVSKPKDYSLKKGNNVLEYSAPRSTSFVGISFTKGVQSVVEVLNATFAGQKVDRFRSFGRVVNNGVLNRPGRYVIHGVRAKKGDKVKIDVTLSSHSSAFHAGMYTQVNGRETTSKAQYSGVGNIAINLTPDATSSVVVLDVIQHPSNPPIIVRVSVNSQVVWDASKNDTIIQAPWHGPQIPGIQGLSWQIDRPTLENEPFVRQMVRTASHEMVMIGY